MGSKKKGEKDEGEVHKDALDEDILRKLRNIFLEKKESRFSNQFPPILINNKK